MNVQLDATVAPDVLYVYAKYKSYSSSQYTGLHVFANLAKQPAKVIKCIPVENTLAIAMSESHIHILKTLPSIV